MQYAFIELNYMTESGQLFICTYNCYSMIAFIIHVCTYIPCCIELGVEIRIVSVLITPRNKEYLYLYIMFRNFCKSVKTF